MSSPTLAALYVIVYSFGMKVDTDDLINSTEVAEIIGLNRATNVSVIRSRHADFPAPIVEKGRCTLWRRQDVEAWARETGRAS